MQISRLRLQLLAQQDYNANTHSQINTHLGASATILLTQRGPKEVGVGGAIPNTVRTGISPDQPKGLPGLGVGLSGRTFAQDAQGSWGR